jgi:hypothetical protein
MAMFGTGANRIQIFISYRREETTPHAGWLHDLLVKRFSSDQVFMDINAIEPGLDYAEVLEKMAGSCDVLIAVIGKQWLSMTDAQGNRRLEDPNDWVRREIAAALARNVRVVPALVDGARMPGVEELPAVLAQLAGRQKLVISNASFQQNVQVLIQALEKSGRPTRKSDWKRLLLLDWPLNASDWIVRIAIWFLLIGMGAMLWFLAESMGDVLFWMIFALLGLVTVAFWLYSFRLYRGRNK